jgi:hypothetical protein
VITFSVPSLAPNQSVTATIEVTVTATTSGTVITNSATASSNETGNIGPSNIITHQVITRPVSPIFMPFIINNNISVPDLIITDFSINPPNPSSTDNIVVTVVVENQGNTTTGEGFWVDFYANPAILPNDPSLGADRRWDNSAIDSFRGIAWEVPALGPGASVTLTSDGSGGGIPPSSEQTIWPGTLPGGSYNFYSFVDSYDNNDPTGPTNVEVVESNENNNLAGPITISIVGGQAVETTESEEQTELPPRPDIGR